MSTVAIALILISSLIRLVARGRKRDSSSCAASQPDRMVSTSASMAEPIAYPREQRPLKRRKRSTSTSAAPSLSQLSTQLVQSRRRSRSRVGSPTADVKYAPPLRVSARLACKTHPFISSRSPDIYTHLAGPDGAGKLLSEPPTGSVISSTSDEMIGSQSVTQSVKQPRGRRRKAVDLADENAKKDLMEEWARMRQSQGTLPLSGIDENACFSQMLLRDARKGDESVSSMQLEVITRRNSLDADLVRKETTTIINIPQSQETMLDVSPRDSFSTQVDFENALPVGTDTSGKQLNHKGSVLPSDGVTGQPIVPGVDMEAPSTSIPGPHMGQVSSSDELADVRAHHLDLLQCSGSSPSTLSASPSREDSVHIRHMKVTELPINDQAEPRSLDNPSKDSHSVTPSQTSSIDSDIDLDSDEEFYMLDIPEIFTLPWVPVPVASQLYVPPSLGKLISGKQCSWHLGIDFICS